MAISGFHFEHDGVPRYNNSNCVRKSAYAIFLGGMENLRPLQSKYFSYSVKTYEEKLKITLLGSCEKVVGLTS